MRLLHTSDWHLGQTLHDFDRYYEHQCFLQWLLDTLETQRADVLLVAGDVFDNPNPAAEAQRQFYHFLTEAKRRIPALDIVIIAGNHDSAGRLEAPAPLLDRLGITVIGAVQGNVLDEGGMERLIVPLHEQGEIAAWGIAIPFLRPDDVPRVPGESSEEMYLAGVRELYRRTIDRAQQRRKSHQALIALGHCHVQGGRLSTDSERRIVIGGAEALPVDLFDPVVTYVGLGHLHRPQIVGGQERVRYSGSPLPLSFSEIDYPHQVVRIDLEGGALREVSALPVPRPVEFLRIPPQPTPLDGVIEALAERDWPDCPPAVRPYLQVRVQLTAPEPGLRAKVEAVLANRAVRLARIEVSSAREAVEEESTYRSLEELERLHPIDLFHRLYQRRYPNTLPDTAILAALRELLEAETTNWEQPP